MEYISVKNPQWANAEKTIINCVVDFVEIGICPFTANPNDEFNPSSKEIFYRCKDGDFGPVADYTPPPPYVPTIGDNKQRATQLLSATDWVNQPDVVNPSITPHLLNQSEFIAYRASLRAIAVNPVAGNIDWPTKPVEQWS